jgi:hypothetical protein
VKVSSRWDLQSRWYHNLSAGGANGRGGKAAVCIPLERSLMFGNGPKSGLRGKLEEQASTVAPSRQGRNLATRTALLIIASVER